jgi:phage replication initiation protein
VPQSVPTAPKAALMSVKAECVRNARWAMETAAPTIATLFQYLDEDQFLELVTAKKLPKRLQSFSKSDLQEAFGEAFNQYVVPRSSPVAQSLH